MDKMIDVLKIINTHGVKGDVKALHFTDGEAFFRNVKRVYSKNTLQPYDIVKWRFHKGAVILTLAGVENMDEAEALKGVELCVRASDLPKLPNGRYYYFQLVGLKAVTPEGNGLGTICDVNDGPGGELLEIDRGAAGKCLVPKCDAFVREISIERGEIVITPIEGLI